MDLQGTVTMVTMLAGLVDAGENAEVTAVRELWEETGYHGTVTSVSPRMFTK